MKITESNLRKIIREELELVSEGEGYGICQKCRRHLNSDEDVSGFCSLCDPENNLPCQGDDDYDEFDPMNGKVDKELGKRRSFRM